MLRTEFAYYVLIALLVGALAYSAHRAAFGVDHEALGHVLRGCFAFWMLVAMVIGGCLYAHH
jgi:hypothetical protein